MAKQSLGMLIVVIAVLIANVPAVMQQWHDDRPGFIKTRWLAAAYVLYVAIGIWFLLTFMAPAGEKGPHVLFALGLLLGWIFYGGLTLMRTVPRYREPPRWLMRFGVVDIVLLAVIFGCAAAAYLWS